MLQSSSEVIVLRIAVCDDDKVYADEIEKNVRNVLLEHSYDAFFDLYIKSNDLIDSHNVYDIAFLDIEMQPFNGIETAKRLKEINESIIIFFITSFDQYLDDAMDLNAFRYIKKPLDITRLRIGLEKALRLIDNTKISFLLKDGNTSFIIESNQIIYIEIVGHYTKIYLRDNCYISANSMEFWAQKLIASFFYRVHKSFIVNLKYITGYSRDTITLCNRYLVPIAYRKQAAFRSYFLSFLGER